MHTIVVTLLARMVIAPLVVTPMMILVSRFEWVGEVFEDPVFIVSNMLLLSSPPALTLPQVTLSRGPVMVGSFQAQYLPPQIKRISQWAKVANGTNVGANADEFSPFERLLSRTVFWAYIVLTPPIAILSVMVNLLLIGA